LERAPHTKSHQNSVFNCCSNCIFLFSFILATESDLESDSHWGLLVILWAVEGFVYWFFGCCTGFVFTQSTVNLRWLNSEQFWKKQMVGLGGGWTI